MKKKAIGRRKNDNSKTKDPTETDMKRSYRNGKEDFNKEDADNTGTDTNSDATESLEEKLKRRGKFDKNKREVDPDMTETDPDPDKTKQPRKK